VDLEDPPFHLVLGRGAVDMMAREMAETVQADVRWAELGRSVDFA
jgi:hypothetical protein